MSAEEIKPTTTTETLDTDKGEHSGNSDQFWATALAIRALVEHRHGVIRRAGAR